MGNVMSKFLVVFLLLVFSVLANAQEGNLLIPMDFENTRVLPKGIRNFRFRGAEFQATDKFDGAGHVVPVGNALNKGVTWNKLIDGKDSDLEKGILKGYLESKDVNLNEEVGQTTGVVGINFQTYVPIFAWGVTEKMTVAMAVPIIKSSLEVDSGFVGNQNLAGIGDQLIRDGSQNKAYELKYKTANAIQEKLRKYNYESLQSRQETRIGDIRLVNKYLFHQSAKFNAALKGMVTMPTGDPTNVNRAVDIGTGDGQWDLGLGVITDYNIGDAHSFTGYAAYINQLPTNRARRIPEEADSKLSPDVDKKTRMDLGDVLNFQLGHKYSFLKGMSFSSAYMVQYKAQDKYSGSQYANERYKWLEKDTAQSMESVHLSLGYSTIQLFREKKFPAPLESNLSFNKVVRGRNAIDDYLIALEMAAYF